MCRERDLDSDGEQDEEVMDSGARKVQKIQVSVTVHSRSVSLQPVQSSVVAMPAPPRPKADPKEDEKSKKRLVLYNYLYCKSHEQFHPYLLCEAGNTHGIK